MNVFLTLLLTVMISNVITENPKSKHLFNKALKEKSTSKKLEYLNNAIAIDSTYLKAINERGVTYSEMNQLNMALNDFNKALNIKKNYAPALLNKGIYYAKLNMIDSAFNYVNLAIESDVNFENAYLARAKLNGKLRHSNEMVMDFKNVLRLNPENLIALEQIAQYEYYKGDFRNSIQVAIKIGSLTDTNFISYYIISMSHASLLNYTEAQNVIRNAVLKVPKKAGIFYYNSACYYARCKDVRNALKALESAFVNDYYPKRSIAQDPDFSILTSNKQFIEIEKKFKEKYYKR